MLNEWLKAKQTTKRGVVIQNVLPKHFTGPFDTFEEESEKKEYYQEDGYNMKAYRSTKTIDKNPTTNIFNDAIECLGTLNKLRTIFRTFLRKNKRANQTVYKSYLPDPSRNLNTATQPQTIRPLKPKRKYKKKTKDDNEDNKNINTTTSNNNSDDGNSVEANRAVENYKLKRYINKKKSTYIETCIS